MMNQRPDDSGDHKVGESLASAIDLYGAAVLREPDKLKTYLFNACPNDARQIDALVSAVAEGVPQSMLAANSDEDLAMRLPKLVDRLAKHTRLGQAGAAWVVRTWARALALSTKGLDGRPVVASAPAPVATHRSSAAEVLGFVVQSVTKATASVASPASPTSSPVTAPSKAESKVELPKVETLKVETPKVETTKAEGPKTETPEAEPAKIEKPAVAAAIVAAKVASEEPLKSAVEPSPTIAPEAKPEAIVAESPQPIVEAVVPKQAALESPQSVESEVKAAVRAASPPIELETKSAVVPEADASVPTEAQAIVLPDALDEKAAKVSFEPAVAAAAAGAVDDLPSWVTATPHSTRQREELQFGAEDGVPNRRARQRPNYVLIATSFTAALVIVVFATKWVATPPPSDLLVKAATDSTDAVSTTTPPVATAPTNGVAPSRQSTPSPASTSPAPAPVDKNAAGSNAVPATKTVGDAGTSTTAAPASATATSTNSDTATAPKSDTATAPKSDMATVPKSDTAIASKNDTTTAQNGDTAAAASTAATSTASPPSSSTKTTKSQKDAPSIARADSSAQKAKEAPPTPAACGRNNCGSVVAAQPFDDLSGGATSRSAKIYEMTIRMDDRTIHTLVQRVPLRPGTRVRMSGKNFTAIAGQ